ncbi:hypothetical protein [Mycobacterium sp.]|uniref:hypothetical protein n=1 Tax=Mycobacterium sp. TaxID=1785 RepID=UPI002D7E176B|nr:hypothetical protein [Mycobacterium sp.]
MHSLALVHRGGKRFAHSGFPDAHEYVDALGTPAFTMICPTRRDAAFRKFESTV